MSWRRMSFPVGADSLAIGPLFRLHVHPPSGHVGFWQWWVEGGAEGLIRPGAVEDPRQVARARAEAAALEWAEQSLAALDRHAAEEAHAARLHGRARQKAMPWYWSRDRLIPDLCAGLPFALWLERGVDEYRWCAGPHRGRSCLEGLARIEATCAAVKLLRTGVLALGGATPWIEARDRARAGEGVEAPAAQPDLGVA